MAFLSGFSGTAADTSGDIRQRIDDLLKTITKHTHTYLEITDVDTIGKYDLLLWWAMTAEGVEPAWFVIQLSCFHCDTNGGCKRQHLY